MTPLRWALLGMGLSLVAALGGLAVLVSHTDPPDPQVATSPLVLDRQGRLLRPFTVDGGRWRLPVDLAGVDPRFIAMLLAFEDRHFRHHPGVDGGALLRAAGQWATHGRIVSGGSTLTMQLVRRLEGRSTRSVLGKLRQILIALALERDLDKDRILTAYLTLAPYGGNLEGVRAASLAWLGKEPRHLSPGEAALLVALPQAPEARRPDRSPEAARRARDRVLAVARRAGVIDAAEEQAALLEPVPRSRHPFPLLAPHTAERLVREQPGLGSYPLSLDGDLQRRLEGLAAERAAALGRRVSAAILVADHQSGQILASVGSAGLFDGPREGYLDMTRAVRSPGSTLKPLIYGLAFEQGIAHPESLIEDRPTGFSGYVPSNFDRTFQGTVSVRQALQRSLNVPAVQILEAVGPVRLLACLRRTGAEPVLSNRSPPGLAIGLGGIGLRLRDLVSLYGAIARGGLSLGLTETLGGPPASPAEIPVLEERAAWHLGSILAGGPALPSGSPGAIAFKTGTSYGYRDAWALGFDGLYVAGVWVGRPDGAPVPGLVGSDAAAPILIDVFARIGPRVPLRPPPPGTLQATSGGLPPPLRRARTPQGSEHPATRAPEIAFPPDGARVDLGLSGPGAGGLALKVRHGSPPFTWFANGAPIAREPYTRTAYWTPDGSGFTTLSVVDGRGQSSQVRVVLE